MKKISFLLSIFFSVLTSFTQLKGSETVQPVRPSYVIVAFGTSLTESVQVSPDKRWTSLLQEILRQRHPELEITVINAGISGSTTRERLPHLEKDVLARHPDLVISDLGANDGTYMPERNVSLEEFVGNVKLMHDQIVSKTGAAEIYWPITPVLNDKHVYRDMPLYVKAGGIDKCAEVYRKSTAKVSRKLHVSFVDMDAIFRKNFNEKGADFYIRSDGIHYTEAGNQLVAQSLLPMVEKIIRHKLKLIASNVNSQTFTVKLWPDSIPGSVSCPDYIERVNKMDCSENISIPEIAVYLPSVEKANGTAVLICPGGGYSCVAAYRPGAISIARRLSEQGIAAFILKYRLPSDKIMKDKSIGPLQDAQKAMRKIRGNATQWHINTAKVGVLGWSAGGHLASTLSTHYNAKVYNADNLSARPDFSILLCPVISFDSAITHLGSRDNLIGQNPNDATITYFSNEQQVTADTPPAFLVHCADDDAVPAKNSLMYFQALRNHKVPAEIHIYQQGGHDGPFKGASALAWFSTCLLWFRVNGWL